jgi:hypothetical protein
MPQTTLADRADHIPLPLPSRPNVWINIQRGRTKFPRRPVLGGRFLIGAGSNCQMQLGGDGMPFLHSVLLVAGQQVTLEAFVPWPELKLNGAPVQTASLLDGDKVSIGPFEFAVQIAVQTEAAEPEDLYAPIPLEIADEPQEDLAALSVAELIEKLEDAEEDVAAFDGTRRAGAAALLDAAWLASESSPEAARELPDVRLLHDLNHLADELQQRLEQMRQREAEQTRRAESVLAAQDRLAEQLKHAAASLAESEPTYRATA